MLGRGGIVEASGEWGKDWCVNLHTHTYVFTHTCFNKTMLTKTQLHIQKRNHSTEKQLEKCLY